MTDYTAKQAALRARLFTAHQTTLDTWWAEDGHYHAKPDMSARLGFRATLWHTLSYLAGDARCIARANRIILQAYDPKPCHFAPGAALDVLLFHRARLTPEVVAALERYLTLNVPFMGTDDLQIHGYNDNHPYKAMHALILGGELLGRPDYVERGLLRLRQAITLLSRNGFPCEYNSPNYTPVSLNPLAGIVEHAANAEARDLALRLERFYWQDLALHWDARCGLPAGPFSRGGGNDYSGLLSGDLGLLSYLFPERFDFDLVDHVFHQGIASPFVTADSHTAHELAFYQAHPVWYASATYHPTEAIEATLFEKPARVSVKGTAETGVSAVAWKTEADRPLLAPRSHRLGPHRSLLTTWHGDGFTLGTAQYSWLNNEQARGFLATISHGPKTRPDHATVYHSAMVFDEDFPFGSVPCEKPGGYLIERGNNRTVQHEGSAMVLYNPMPTRGTCKRIRTGIFRPLYFHAPRALYLGDLHVPDLNVTSDHMAPIAIDEGGVYIGFIPLRLTDLGQSHNAHLVIQTYTNQLAILISSLMSWGPRTFAYDELLAVNSGFICEVAPANDFASFTDFRRWLAQAAAGVDDRYFGEMRTTTYTRPGLQLSTCYSPLTQGFRHTAINNQPVSLDPPLQISGMPYQAVDLTRPVEA